MRHFLFVAIAVLAFNSVSAQINAITEHGDQVILKQDGTWEYLELASDKEPKEVYENPTPFEKNATQKFLVKSSIVNVGIYINPKSWKFEKGDKNAQQEYIFQNIEKDIYAILITEKISIPLQSLKKLVLQNAEEVGKNVKVVKEEMRTVNGVKVYYMQFEGSIDGIDFAYIGYFYSSDDGTIQLLGYTGKNLIDKYNSEIETFLNGFTLVNK